MATAQKTAVKKVPAKACQFGAGQCEFAAGEAGTSTSRGPIRLTASSGMVFVHPWWGRMVFDVGGMKLAKPRVTLDYCHRVDEVVGYADQIDASQGHLAIAGELVSAVANDRAAEILTKGPAGVPYEASVKFDPYNGLVVEEYADGIPAQVNGRTELGPLTVIRQCLLRGVAVCPYGGDPYTQTEFSASEADADVTITHFPSEHVMPDSQTKTPDQVRTELVAANQDYVTRFGAELAAKWGPLGEGKPLVDCYAEFVAQLRAGHDSALAAKDTAHAAAVADLTAKLEAAQKKAAEAEARVASLSLGESEPVSGGAPPTQLPTELAAGLTPGLAKFVAAQRATQTGK